MTIRLRTTSAIVCILLLAGTSALGGSVQLRDVIQVTGTDYSLPKLRLREPFTPAVETLVVGNGSVQEPLGARQTASSDPLRRTTTAAGPATHDSTDSLLSSVAVDSELTQTTISVVGQGSVDGTICDCGEITVPGGGFPKWTLLFLGAIPLSFIHGTETLPPTSNPTPGPFSTPTTTLPPTIPQAPEPASLLLFGFGLAALASFQRRTRAK